MKLIPLLGVCALVTACDNGAIVLNAAPSVTAVGPVTTEADGLHVYVWVRDHERNATDLTLRIVSGGVKTTVVSARGDGFVGLTSAREAIGEPHRLILDAAALPVAFALEVTATDSDGGAGPTFLTPEFTLAAGLPTP